jgi:ATP-dependent Clp protease ATP-binding subunit ClpA
VGPQSAGTVAVFSASLEIVLTIAYREAVSRRHAYLTLEHLLYALAHDPEGERILKGCGADLVGLRRDLSDYFDQSLEAVRRGQEREPEQTAAFRRVLQTAVLHVQSAQRAEVNAGDILAAILQQPKSQAARQRRSPATISYRPSTRRTRMGWRMPLDLIDCASSSSRWSSMSVLGCRGLGCSRSMSSS